MGNTFSLCFSNEDHGPTRGPTDAFFTHDWGKNEDGTDNHEIVKKINEWMKRHGIITWFDEDCMTDNIQWQMTDGVDKTKCVVVFITKNYLSKVGKGETTDSCCFEFQYEHRRLKSSKMIPVLMEKSLANQASWTGIVGGALGGKLYIDMTGHQNPAVFEANCEKLASEIRKITGSTVSNSATDVVQIRNEAAGIEALTDGENPGLTKSVQPSMTISNFISRKDSQLIILRNPKISLAFDYNFSMKTCLSEIEDVFCEYIFICSYPLLTHVAGAAKHHFLVAVTSNIIEKGKNNSCVRSTYTFEFGLPENATTGTGVVSCGRYYFHFKQTSGSNELIENDLINMNGLTRVKEGKKLVSV